jgi:protease PrsW
MSIDFDGGLFFLLSVGIAILPAFVWLGFWYRKDFVEPEPRKMILLAFFLGMITTVPFFLFRFFFGGVEGGGIQNIFFLAFCEEIAKAIAVLFLGKILKIHFTQIVDGIVYAASLGIGFAFAENCWYFFSLASNTQEGNFFWLFFFRSAGTMLAHALFSGVFGFLWAYAFFSQQITPKHSFSVLKIWQSFFRTIRLHILFSHILSSRPSLHGHEKAELVREGLFLAIILHSIFNIALDFSIFGNSLTPLVIPLLMMLLFFLSEQFLQKKNINIQKPL